LFVFFKILLQSEFLYALVYLLCYSINQKIAVGKFLYTVIKKTHKNTKE